MPTYEFRCKRCSTVFEERRLMADADAPATCPDGHDDVVRLLSVFASVGTTNAPAPAPRGGGCGTGCGCH